MAFRDDVAKFQTYMYERYGKSIRVHECRSYDIDEDDPRVSRWVSAVSEYFNIDKSILFSKGRKNNSYEKIWFRYMLVREEGLTMNKIYKMLNLADHSTLVTNIKVCDGWVEAYPDVYKGIVEVAKKYNLIREGKIKIVYE
jgi:hypothetical protein